MTRVVVVLLGLCALSAVTFVGRSLGGHGRGNGWRGRSSGLVRVPGQGDVYWHFAFDELVDPPSPNTRDLFFFTSFVTGLAGTLRLIRDRLAPLLLDGLTRCRRPAPGRGRPSRRRRSTPSATTASPTASAATSSACSPRPA